MSGAEIREWRKRLGQSRAWVGEQCGVSARTVEAWEQGLRHPGGSALLLLERLVAENEPKIIITTVQKFPVICDELEGEGTGKNFAIIIDEAHSNQGGKNDLDPTRRSGRGVTYG